MLAVHGDGGEDRCAAFAVYRPERSNSRCFRAFRVNHWFGFAVFAGVAADLALR